MSDPAVTAYVTKLLCSHGGRLERDRLGDVLDLPGEQIEQILQEESDRFPETDQLVLARTDLRICYQYLYSSGGCQEGQCSKLHLCSHYLKGRCYFNRRPPCKFCHDINSDHNLNVLKVNELSGLNEEEIKVLLYQNDSGLLPQDCAKYMKDECDQGEDCPRLHLCRYFSRGECYARFCRRSHNVLDSDVMLSCGWLSTKSIENFHMLCVLKHNERHKISGNEDWRQVLRARGRSRGRRRERSRGRRRERSRTRGSSQDLLENRNKKRRNEEASIEETPVICLSNIWKYCKLEGRCPDMHYYLPYRWQVLDGTVWHDLPNMEDTEKAYSDPKNDSYQSINFQLMRSGARRIRRLSTPSSVTLPSEYVLTTEWIWYWKGEFGSWVQYEQTNTINMSANILASELENIYLSHATDTIQFSVGNWSYSLNFQEMRQRNYQNQIEREVRRRPKFLDFENVKMLKRSTKSTAKLAASPLETRKSNPPYPKEWNMEAIPEVGFRKVLVSEVSSKFSKIVTMFRKTVLGQKVKRLWHVQNPALWQVYQWQKDQMKKKNSGIEVQELQLFHGTDSRNTEHICAENFDWRVCGTNGTVYGQGSYFARDASYSHHYAPATSGGTRTMFVARVLVGDFVEGNSSMRRPPKKRGGAGQSYDSCVDNVFDPSIYVVFEKSQIYPEFILEYEADSWFCAIS